MKAIIDPRCNIFYSSYYIKGMRDMFGEKNISFSMKYFKELEMDKISRDSYFSFVILNEDKKYKVVLDFGDKTQIIEGAYNWCDKYAKINYNNNEIPEKYHGKMIVIPPGFGIRIWSLSKTIYYAFSNLIKSMLYSPVNIYIFLHCYGMSYRRPVIDSYMKEIKSQSNYIFFISTLWNLRFCVETTNKLRYQFITKAKAMKNMIFEGGFCATPENREYEKYKDVVSANWYKSTEYVNKTKLSCVVFNTPAVHNCHGWKLGEFIAMGKAIISTPLHNNLREDLIHGVNVHFVKNESEMGEALQLICNNDVYRLKLETNIKLYYNKLVSPLAVMSTILSQMK